MNVSIIVACDVTWSIGKNNELPWGKEQRADLARFRYLTTGNTVIMGRCTYQSIGKALPNRRNIVISGNPEFIAQDCEIATSIEHAIGIANTEPVGNEIFIIGGEAIYNAAMPYVNKIHHTLIFAQMYGDRHFEPVGLPEWKTVKETFHHADINNKYDYCFITYVRA